MRFHTRYFSVWFHGRYLLSPLPIFSLLKIPQNVFLVNPSSHCNLFLYLLQMAKAICIYYLFIYLFCCFSVFLLFLLETISTELLLCPPHIPCVLIMMLLWLFSVFMLLLFLFLLQHLPLHHTWSVPPSVCLSQSFGAGMGVYHPLPSVPFCCRQNFEILPSRRYGVWDHISIDYLATPLCRAPFRQNGKKQKHDVIQQWNKYVSTYV